MQKDFYKSLKSGTDVRGVALKQDVVPSSVSLDQTAAYDIAAAFVLWLKNRTGKERLSVAVGHDSRVTAPSLLLAITEAFKAGGCDIHSCGLITTPAMFMMTKFSQTRADGVIMITASHHPFYMNGMKFFTESGGISSKELESILSLASELRASRQPLTDMPIDTLSEGTTQTDELRASRQPLTDMPFDTLSEGITQTDTLADGKTSHSDITLSEEGSNGYRLFTGDYLGLYAELLRKQISEFSLSKNRSLEGMKIVVDAGNGAAGFFAGSVLEPLGADVSGSQFLEPDGYFPNHVPNPEDKHAIKSIKECVLKNKADLGIIFDTDGDRVGIVTSDGSEINRNRLIAAATALLLERKENIGAYIVTDSVTSEGLGEFITAKGGNHLRFKRGYKNVIDKAVELCKDGKNACLAIETSGHAAFRENYFLDDGAYLAVRLIAKAVQLKREGRSLNELIAGLKEPLESIEARLLLTCDDWKASASRIITELTSYSDQHFITARDNYEGIRAVDPENDGWFLLRLSVHDPVMPLNIESNKPNGAKQIAQKLLKFFSRYDMLDVSMLK